MTITINFPTIGAAECRLYHNAEYPANWIERNDAGTYYLPQQLAKIKSENHLRLHFSDNLTINGVEYSRLVFDVTQRHEGQIFVYYSGSKVGSKDYKSSHMTDKAKEVLAKQYDEAIKAMYPHILPKAVDIALKEYNDQIALLIGQRLEGLAKLQERLKDLGGFVGHKPAAALSNPPTVIREKKAKPEKDRLSYLDKNSWYKRSYSSRMTALSKMPMSYVRAKEEDYKMWKEGYNPEILNQPTSIY